MLIEKFIKFQRNVDHQSCFYTIGPIFKECSTFFAEGLDIPLYKTLPKASGSFKRVKVRHRNLAADNPYSFLAEKFGATFPKRTVDCSTTLPLVESTDRDLYYIFPTNGYKVVYSRHIDNLRDTCDSLTEAVLQTHMTVGIDWLEDVTRDAYEFSPSLKHAADGGDILVYNMSHFYAIRASDYNYSDILKFANKGLN